MDIAQSSGGGEKGSGGEGSQTSGEEKIGDIAIQIGMTPDGRIVELGMSDAMILKVAGRWAYRGRTTDGRMTTRFVDTAMGHSEATQVGVFRNLPKQ